MNYADQSLAELAISIPMSTELFRRHRLDFCCGGKLTLKEACLKNSVELRSIEKSLTVLSEKKSVPESRSAQELVTFIIDRYHEDLRQRFPELITLSKKIENVHFDHPLCPKGLTTFLQVLHEEMLMHMMKEENILFPLISSGRGALTQMPIKVMGLEHESHGRKLEELREIVCDYVPPVDACATWRALYKGLEKLEEELMEHIHLENNVLFPKALSGA